MRLPFHRAFKTMAAAFLLLFPVSYVNGWGFYAHRRINQLAVFTLPPEMIDFYKRNLQFIAEEATAPDKRRYVVEEEAPRHYIDLEVYGDSACYTLPRYWSKAVEQYSEDTLMAYGVVPWHIQLMAQRLTAAFMKRDAEAILRLSADLGHYIADAHVPLHTTENYNGQLTGQQGIHGLWESRLPELFAEKYDFFVGPAVYLESLQKSAWGAVIGAHEAVDSVFTFERVASEKFSEDKKYSYEERGSTTVRVYSKEFSNGYHRLLQGQVERQMTKAVKMVGDVWFTCWVNAGQPDLNNLRAVAIEKDSVLNAVEEEGHDLHPRVKKQSVQ